MNVERRFFFHFDQRLSLLYKFIIFLPTFDKINSSITPTRKLAVAMLCYTCYYFQASFGTLTAFIMMPTLHWMAIEIIVSITLSHNIVNNIVIC